MKNLLGLFISGIILIIYSCSTPIEKEVQTSDQNETLESKTIASTEMTKKVLNRHMNAFVENDIEALMSDYSEESIVITPDTIYRGLDEIRALLTALLTNFPAGEYTLEADKVFVDNEVAYIVWHASTPTIEIPFATDTFIIEDEKIKRQTFAGIINPVESQP